MPEDDEGMARLADEVLADARRKADRRRKAAERDAEKAIESARTRAEAEAARIRDAARERAGRQRQRILATVGQEVRRRRLLKQARVIEEHIHAGFDRMAALAGDERRAVLVGLAAAAIRQMDADAFRLEVGAADQALVDEAFLAEVKRRLAEDDPQPPALTVAEEPAPIGGGVIVRAADGLQMVDNSFEGRRARLAGQLRQILAGVLFPQREETADKAAAPPGSEKAGQ